MNNFKEVWDEKHYKFGNYRELQGVEFNFGENQGKSNIMLTSVIIFLWACLCLLAF